MINPYTQEFDGTDTGLCPLLVYIAIQYLTQNKSPSKKKGFVSIIEDYPLTEWRDLNSRPPAPKE
tara:strand:- start:492 stop:686 length:195 start_codon:yes stop_codon:yes gene_type:complete